MSDKPEKFYILSEDTINDFMDVFNTKSFPLDVKFEFIGNSKQKKLIVVSRIADENNFLYEKDVKVSINEALMDSFDEKIRTILIEQEIDKIGIDLKTGKIKFLKLDVEFSASSGLVQKYGLDEVAKANGIEFLASEQKQDMDSDFIV
jgi:hypothetical protein